MTTPRDTVMATRMLKGISGLLHTAHALGTLDLASLSRLLPSSGLVSRPSDLDALFGALGVAGEIKALRALPWAGDHHVVDSSLLVRGWPAMVDAAVRLAAGHTRGKVGASIAFESGAEAHTPMQELLSLQDDGKESVLLVIGPPELTVDLVSPAARDLTPVLRVLASRHGWTAPDAHADAPYELLPMLQAEGEGVRDERAANDARAGIHATSDGAWIHLGQLDSEAADARIQPDAWRAVADGLMPRVRAALVLGAAECHGGAAGELPAMVVHAQTGRSVADLLVSPALNAREIGPEHQIVVGETAVGAPGLLLAGLARRAVQGGKGAVTTDDVVDALMDLQQAAGTGALAARCKLSLALFDARRPAVGRAMVAAFLNQNLAVPRQESAAPARAGAPSKKIRIRG